MVEIYKGIWDKNKINNIDKIFIYGDNDSRFGFGGQAIIRNTPNSFGLRTKKFPGYNPIHYYNDNEYEQNCENILEDILSIKELSLSNKIVFSEGGYGNGLANLKKNAPKTFEFLCDKLKHYFNFNNETGKRFISIPGHDELSKGIYVSFLKEDIIKPENNDFFKSEFLNQNLYKTQDLIKSCKKISFTSSEKYNINDIIILMFEDDIYLICRVIDSNKALLNKQWYSFEGYDNKFIPNLDNKFQTNFEYISTLNKNGEMIFKGDIFG